MTNKEELSKIHVLGQDNQQQFVQLMNVDRDDEINLLDLWLVLTKRRFMLFAIFLAFLIAGIAFSFIKPVAFEYTAVLQIGKILVDNDGVKSLEFIESPGNVLEKLNKSYIPLAQVQYLNENPQLTQAPKITVKLSKNSDLLVVTTRGQESDALIYLAVIQSVVDSIQKDHQPQLDVFKNKYEFALQKEVMALEVLTDPVTLKLKKKTFETKILNSNIIIQNLNDELLVSVHKQQLIVQNKNNRIKLAALSDEFGKLTADLSRIDEVDKLLESRITDLSDTIEKELHSRKKTINNINSGPEAMTVLLLDNQIQSNRNKLSDIEERLTIKQKSLREKLNNQIKSNKRSQYYHKQLISDIDNKLQKQDIDNEQAQQIEKSKGSALQLGLAKMLLDHQNNILLKKEVIAGLQYELNGLRDTRAVIAPMKSLESVGIGKKLIVIVSLMAGLFVAIFVVFFTEFLSNVKKRAQTV
ncbi:MAG: hypothetical protein DIZ80_13915 [endosymbiont of Galathealinum brachiosum]|uniref:Polysaccharide chain length determinant N-terminal domain-containing protein n=1 Tax=endosymbiont of Galathealinum brachiosum TaxID=2200906 RepID=A0A370D9F5_9GAMM|nr:MAG: hypothetical protein DIZ80_13915 [endosymbiont of Galathealinum brachiosum]